MNRKTVAQQYTFSHLNDLISVLGNAGRLFQGNPTTRTSSRAQTPMFSNFSLNELNDNKTIIEQSTNVANKLAQELQKLKVEHEDLVEEKEKLLKEKSEFEKTIGEKEAACQKLTEEVRDLTEKSAATNGQLGERITELEARLQAKSEELDSTNLKLTEFKNLADKTSGESEKISEQLERVAEEHKQKNEAKDLKIELQGLEINKLNDDLGELMKDYEEIRSVVFCKKNVIR